MSVRPSYLAIEDKDLVVAALAGRQEACDELVRRYRGAVLYVAGKAAGSHEAAQDAAQEAFLQAFAQLKQLKDPARFGPWLCTIARNRARYVRRRECRSQPVEDEELDVLLAAHAPDRFVSPVEALLQSERDNAIRDLIAGLPEGVQIVIQLYYVEQWDVARIAEFLSLTRTTVKWRLHSGRKKISRALLALLSDEDPEPISEINTPSGKNSHGKDQKERDQAGPAHAGRDRVPCGGGRTAGRGAQRSKTL